MDFNKTVFIVMGTIQELGLDIFNQLLKISDNIITINRSPFQDESNITFDISHIEDIEEKLIKKLSTIVETYPNIVLILNASLLNSVKEIGNYKTGDIIKIVNANIISSIILANFIVNQQKEGIAIDVSSGGIEFNFEELGLYTATKIATHKFFKISNIEKNNIDFIDFDPGTMDTQMTVSLRNPNNHLQVASREYLLFKEEDKAFPSTTNRLLEII